MGRTSVNPNLLSVNGLNQYSSQTFLIVLQSGVTNTSKPMVSEPSALIDKTVKSGPWYLKQSILSEGVSG